MWREMIIFADRQTIKQTDTNSKTEAHSYPLWIVGERANSSVKGCANFSSNSNFTVWLNENQPNHLK